MNYESAVQLLGLGASEVFSREQLRRAYMRRLRLYPPEKDPEGFRRLRQAFELLEWHAHDASTDERVGDEPVPLAPRVADRAVLEPEQPETFETTIEHILGKLAAEEIDSAVELSGRLREDTVDDHRALGLLLTRRWALTRELLTIARVLPSPILTGLAEGIRANDLRLAYPALEHYRRTYWDKSHDLRVYLARRAPSIFAVVSAAFDGTARRLPGPRVILTSRHPLRIVVWLLVVVGVVAALMFGDDCEKRARHAPVTSADLRAQP